MSASAQVSAPRRARSLAGLARSFRLWAAEATVIEPPLVAGANDAERRLLGALGGIARAIGGAHVAEWTPHVRQWATSAPEPPDEVMDAVLEVLGVDGDPFSALYDASISGPNRRRLGTVFTPAPLVDHMLRLAARELREPPVYVVDPGAGVGAFSLAAARRWPSARVIAVDVNVVTLGLLAARTAFEADRDDSGAALVRSIELVEGDYLDQLDWLYAPDTDGTVLALGNPPYTRMQELPREARHKAASLAQGVIDSGHANLAVLFQAATQKHMRPADISCMVVPGSFAYTRASAGLRRVLWESRRAIEVQRTPATTRVFRGRSVQATVVLVGAERKRKPPLQLRRIRLEAESVEVMESWSCSRADEPPANWFWSQEAHDQWDADSVPLADAALVKRGVATGANEMFFLTDDEASPLPASVLVPGVASLRAFKDHDLTDEAHGSYGGANTKRWLLAISPDAPLAGQLREYVESYEVTVKDRHLPSKRRPWYAITALPRPQILVSPLSKTSFKVVLNSARAVPSNNLFGITLLNGSNPGGLAEWLRSTAGQSELRRVSRRYHGGSHKLEPGDLRRIRVPKMLLLN